MQTCRSACSAAVSVLHLRVCIRAEKGVQFPDQSFRADCWKYGKNTPYGMHGQHQWAAHQAGRNRHQCEAQNSLPIQCIAGSVFSGGNHVSQTSMLSIIHFETTIFTFTVHNKQTSFSSSINLAWQIHVIGNAQLSVPGSRRRSDQALVCSSTPVVSFGFV